MQLRAKQISDAGRSRALHSVTEREELPFGSHCLHAIAPQSSNAFLRGRPSEPSEPGGHGRERKRKCRNCESLDPADLAAGHNLWAHPEGREGGVKQLGHRRGCTAVTPPQIWGGAPVAFCRNRWRDCKLGEEPHALNEYRENEGRGEPTGSSWTFTNGNE